MLTEPLTIIVVCYNSADILEWQAARSGFAHFLIVDNGSSDDTASRARALGHEVLRLERNVGFGQGAMAGLHHTQADLALILNPDAYIDASSMVALADAATRYPDCDLFVPRVVDEGGHQSFRHDTTLEPRVKRRELPWGDCCVPMISGAAILVRRRNFIVAGGFDPAIFLYFEDDDIALRFRAERRSMIHVEAATAVHLGNASSTGESTASVIKDRNWGWSNAYVARKHGVPIGVTTIARMYLDLVRYALTRRTDRYARQRERIRGFKLFLKGKPAPGATKGQ